MLPPSAACKAAATAMAAIASVAKNHNCNVCLRERHLRRRMKNSNSGDATAE